MRFLYKLRDVREIAPWGAAEDRNLHWFGLSDGAYCVDTVAGRLLEHTDAPDAQFGVSWCGYAVVRLFEDLLEAWPHSVEPVPPDVTARFFAWAGDPRAGVPDDDDLAAAWFEAHGWWAMRKIDLGYLVGAPALYFWSSGANIHLRWRADETWVVQRADLIEPQADFRTAVHGFVNSFLGEMRVRVETIARDGWSGKPCRIDIPQLVAEQDKREEQARKALGLVAQTDWDHVRRMLDFLGA